MTEGSGTAGGPEDAEPLGVVVVSIDATRLGQYREALHLAGVTSALTADADEAEAWLRERQPTSLVLDQGLPRLAVFRLYGLVRSEEDRRDIAVLFVGQQGHGSAEDHYLPADASPQAVAAQAQHLAARRDLVAASDAETVSTDVRDRGTPSGLPADTNRRTPVDVRDPSEQPVVVVNAVPVRPARQPDETADEIEVQKTTPAPGRGRRLDTMLFWGGVVLLALGVAAVALNPFTAAQVPTPPTVVPPPPASPSPVAQAAPWLALDGDLRHSR